MCHAQAMCLCTYGPRNAVCRSRGLNQRVEATGRILIKYVDGARGRVTGGAARTLSAPRSASLIILDFISREESEVISPVIIRVSVPGGRPEGVRRPGSEGVCFYFLRSSKQASSREYVL